MRAAPCLLVAGCASLHALPPDQPCLEAGYAIARRTLDCTGDPDLANQRFELFQQEYVCKTLPAYDIDTGIATAYLRPEDSGLRGVKPPDFFHCGLAIQQLACELVLQYGDDLWRYLESSDACAWVVEPAGGGE